MITPKEHPGSRPVKVLARSATRGINRYFLPERTLAGYGRKNLGRHITIILRRSNQKRVV